jgi:hypothetical protein
MRFLAAVFAVLAATVAYAEGPPGKPFLCRGMTAREANRRQEASGNFLRDEPSEARVITCGGGVDKEGEPLGAWPCFRQVWRAKDGVVRVILIYGRASGDVPWILDNGWLCSGNKDDSCSPLPLELCEPTLR